MNKLTGVGNFLKDTPQWAKGVVTVVVLAGVAFLGYKVYQKVKDGQDSKAGRRDKKQLEKEGQKPTYLKTNYESFANQIYQAGFVFGGTDEDVIYGVIDKMKNDLDVTLLSEAFGKRRLEFSMQESDLGGFLASELDESEIKKVNDILKKNGVTFKF